jgi:hypothetical protein
MAHRDHFFEDFYLNWPFLLNFSTYNTNYIGENQIKSDIFEIFWNTVEDRKKFLKHIFFNIGY